MKPFGRSCPMTARDDFFFLVVSIQTISLEDFVKHEKVIKDSYSVAWNSSHNPGKGLGLQLIYRHSDGSVLVDRLNSSRDGNPSPAQLSGVIRAGDTMLYVNEVELAALDLFNLTELLKDLDKIAEVLHCCISSAPHLDHIQSITNTVTHAAALIRGDNST